MNLDKIKPGKSVPDIVNVVIEIPANAGPVKYEIDKSSGALMVDRFLVTAMRYPADYGFIPHTLSEDGDPVDVLVLTPAPLLSGAVIACRPIGVLEMVDESGEDAKILAVPVDELSTQYRNVHSPDDLAPQTLRVISHFFEHYKDLEPGKWTKIKGWSGPDLAKQEIINSVNRFATEGVV